VDVRLREPGATKAIHARVDGRAIAFDGVAQALAVPGSDLRLFGKPDAYRKRRMGVALATADTVAEARERAAECAQRVIPQA
jgi:phosphoribosylglycinamide formyltransferase 2